MAERGPDTPETRHDGEVGRGVPVRVYDTLRDFADALCDSRAPERVPRPGGSAHRHGQH